ncbi:MAG: hypothetical protein ACRC2K_13370 [Clostridium sp.]
MISREMKKVLDGRETAMAITSNEYKRILKESRSLQKKEARSIKKINNKAILKQRFVQLYVSGFYTNKQIADILMISEASVRTLLKQPDVMDLILEYANEEKQIIDTRIKAMRFKAVDVMNELMDADDDNIKLSAAKDILDRAGHKADSNSNVNINVSYEQQLGSLIEGVSFEELGINAEDLNITEGAD